MKRSFFALIAPIAFASSSMVFANDQIQDHNGNEQGIASAAYALADAGQFMASYSWRYDNSVYYSANEVHMAASALYHATGNDEPWTSPDGDEIESDHTQDHTNGNLSGYWYRIQTAYYNLQNSYNNCYRRDSTMDRYYYNVQYSYQNLSRYF